jgi:hypothetical protein
MDLAPVHSAIFSLISTKLAAHGAVAFDGKIPVGTDVPVVKNALGADEVRPHAVLYIGDDDDHPLGQHITGVADGLGVLPFAVLCVGNTHLDTTKVRDLVKRALESKRPTTDCGEIQRGGGIAVQPVPGLLQPQRFARTIEFWVNVGASGAPV